MDPYWVRRAKGLRTTIPGNDGRRAGDLLNRDHTALAPTRTCVMEVTYVRCRTGFVYVALILDVSAQKVVAWNPSLSTLGETGSSPAMTEFEGEMGTHEDDRIDSP